MAASVALLDWVTKFAVSEGIRLNDFVIVLEDRVALWHVRNPALVLGLFGDFPLAYRMGVAVLLGLAGLVLLAEVVSRARRLRPTRRRWAWLFVGLVFGGMLGNLGERVLHWWVTDFLTFRVGSSWLPPGNVADLAILLSMPLAPLVVYFELEARRGRRGDEGSGGREGG